MRLSDNSGPTFSGPGSPGPRRRWGRKKTLAAALALTAVTGVAGVTLATNASAAQLGTRAVIVSRADANNWGAGWGKAWSACRAKYRNTKSVRFVDSNDYGPNTSAQMWACRDTP